MHSYGTVLPNYTILVAQCSAIKICKTQAELILNHVNSNLCGTAREEASHRKYKRLKLSGSQAHDHSAD
jgi:hypothetical protein